MSQDLYKTYLHLEKEKLFAVVLSSEGYTPEAVSIAKEVAYEKNWITELNSLMEKQLREQALREDEDQETLSEKAEYYKNLLDFKSQNCSFEVRIADIPKLEGALLERNIPFFREDKNIGAQLDVYPAQMYYFKQTDAEELDLLVKEIGLVTTPYMDVKPFFKKEILVAGAVILVVLIVLAFIF